MRHVDPHVAAALVGAGITSWAELGDAALKRVEEALAGTEHGTSGRLSVYDISSMQRDAMRLAGTGVLQASYATAHPASPFPVHW